MESESTLMNNTGGMHSNTRETLYFSMQAEPATFFFHPEEEMLQQYAEFTQDFKLTTPPTVAESKNTFEDYGIAPARRMMLIHKDKIPEVVQLMANNSQW